MNEKILSALITAILGFIAFLYSKVFYKPIVQYRTLKSKTVHALVYYACVFHNPVDLADMPDGKLPEKYEEASNELRKLAAEWKAMMVRKQPLGFCIPKNKTLEDVSQNLIGLCNGVIYPYRSKDSSTIKDNTKFAAEIKRLLKIH